jgi:GNAT superfamily N-acetyltransferase
MAETFMLPNAPDIPNLCFRYFADNSDFDALVAVIEACQAHDQVDPLSTEAGIPTVEEVTKSFSEADNIDLYHDMLLACVGEEIVGFQWVRHWEQADGTWVYYHRGRVVPHWRQRGIGTATMRWAEARIETLVDQHNTRGRAVMQANTTMHEGPYNEVLLKDRGRRAPCHCRRRVPRRRPGA